MVPTTSRKVSRVSRYSGSCLLLLVFAYEAFTLSGGLSQNPSANKSEYVLQSITPEDKSSGLASFPFARRYLGNRCFFLFLLLLRCFSSEGFLHMAMYLPCSDTVLPYRVSPFGYLRVYGYLLLTAAFRSLSRPSSAPDAKSFSLRSL